MLLSLFVIWLPRLLFSRIDLPDNWQFEWGTNESHLHIDHDYEDNVRKNQKNKSSQKLNEYFNQGETGEDLETQENGEWEFLKYSTIGQSVVDFIREKVDPVLISTYKTVVSTCSGFYTDYLQRVSSYFAEYRVSRLCSLLLAFSDNFVKKLKIVIRRKFQGKFKTSLSSEFGHLLNEANDIYSDLTGKIYFEEF